MIERLNEEESLSPQAGRSIRLLAASSNPGKLREYRALSAASLAGLAIELDLLPRFADLPPFDESAPTFAENAAGKALHYSRYADGPVFADDSGLEVAALDGAPGVQSARYAGPDASDGKRITMLLGELGAHGVADRRAQFVCVLALAERGRTLGIFSELVQGEILDAPRGAGGFGYDPVFYFRPLAKTFAELSQEEKNLHSHRGKAFRKLLEFLTSPPVL
jgi:XTP/dITP diphosphohydrolase